MKNILTIYVHVKTKADERFNFDDEKQIVLENSKTLLFEKGASLVGDTSSDMWDDLWNEESFVVDIKRFFEDTDITKVNWQHYEFPQELCLLFEETWGISYTEYGLEQDYECKYLGILNVDALTEASCFKYEDKHG